MKNAQEVYFIIENMAERKYTSEEHYPCTYCTTLFIVLITQATDVGKLEKALLQVR